MRDENVTQNAETERVKKPSPHPPSPGYGATSPEPVNQSLADSAVNKLALTPALSPRRGESSADHGLTTVAVTQANTAGSEEGTADRQVSPTTEDLKETAEGAGESGRALRGKIARLPKHVREELNRRMDDGESGSSLAKWLNELPVVKKVLARYFGGSVMIEKNISNWRTGGYKRWEERQERLAEIRELAEEAEDFSRVAGENFARKTVSIAAVKILKMLHAIKPEDCTPGELSKVAFAITALAQVEHTSERLKLEKTRVYQGNERLVLSWDKHLRGCVATAQRVMDDEMAHNIQHSDIDNGQKIELLGHYLFKDRWVGRTHGPMASPDVPLEMAPGVGPVNDPRQGGDGTKGTHLRQDQGYGGQADGGEPSPHPSPLPSHPMGAERGQQLDGVRDSVAQGHAAVVPPTVTPEAADQQVRPTMVQVSPAVVGETSEVSAIPEANPLAHPSSAELLRRTGARGSVTTAAEGAGGTPVPLAEARISVPPKSRATLEEDEEWARICRRSRECYASLVASGATQKPKGPPPNPLYAPPPDQPQPGQTTPHYYGPCEPPLTKSTLYNFGPPPGWNSLG